MKDKWEKKIIVRPPIFGNRTKSRKVVTVHMGYTLFNHFGSYVANLVVTDDGLIV